MAIVPDPMHDPSPEIQQLYDELASMRGIGDGFYRALLNSPSLTRRVKDLGTYLRFKSIPPIAVREAAIMSAAAEMKATFVWDKHVTFAREGGIDDRTLHQIWHGKLDDIESQTLRNAARVGRSIVHGDVISPEVQEQLQQEYQVAGFVEIVAIAAFYCFVAAFNAALDVTRIESSPKEL